MFQANSLPNQADTVLGDSLHWIRTPRPPPTDDWQTFRFQRGSSDKFWRIAQRGTDLTVNYGRSGTKGQTVTKSYDDEARARREATKLILEKTRKGYVEE